MSRPIRLAGLLLVAGAVALGVVGVLQSWAVRREAGHPAELEPQHGSSADFEYARSLVWGEVNRHEFTPLRSPRYVSSEEASEFLSSGDRVLVFRKRGEVFVYPETFMAFHHVVNDSIGKRSFAVTTCRLSGSSAVYATDVGGRTLTLGVEGVLYAGNSILFDFQTDSRWLQLNGAAIEGPLEGVRLRKIGRLDRTTWDCVRGEPGARVLAPVHPLQLYRDFESSSEGTEFGLRTLLAVRRPDDRLRPYASGVGVAVRGESRFYPLERLKRARVVNDVLGGWSLLVVYDTACGCCRVFRRFTGGVEHEFRLDGDALVDEGTASRWSLDGRASAGPLAGATLDSPDATEVFWYAWSAVHPATSIW